MPRGVYDRAKRVPPVASPLAAEAGSIVPRAVQLGPCGDCAFFKYDAPAGLCRRYPTAIKKLVGDGCGEFTPKPS